MSTTEESSTPPGVALTLRERDWTRLISQIETGMVIPVVGGELSRIKIGSPPTEQLLSTYVARRVSQDLELDGSPHTSLTGLAYAYLKKYPNRIDELYIDVFEVLRNLGDFEIPVPLMQLAEIRTFPLFISTTFDPCMALALNRVRFQGNSNGATQALSYQFDASVDIPEQFPKIDYPIVYHLFGEAQANPDYVLTDEDVLEFMHKLQAEECRPPRLFDAIHRRRLLVLGCKMGEWLARFFVRTGATSRLRQERGRRDYLVDISVVETESQAVFFENFGGASVLTQSAPSFIDELHRRWIRQHPESIRATNQGFRSEGTTDVFLSYASEDVEFASRLRERLVGAGLKVWFDKESLRVGDNWDSKISEAIQTCRAFLPILSTNAKRGSYRHVRKEWQEALDRKKGSRGNQQYIFPVAVDAVSPDDAWILDGIRKLHWARWDDEQSLSDVTALLVDEISRARRNNGNYEPQSSVARVGILRDRRR